MTKPKKYSIGMSIVVYDETGWNVKHSILNNEVVDCINGSNIIESYIITSIVEISTFNISSEQMGLGYTENLDYSVSIVNPLFIDNTIVMNYISENWTFLCSNIYIEDINGKEINDNSEVEVYFIDKYSYEIVDVFTLKYLIDIYWNGNYSLQHLHESEIIVKIIAFGEQQYGSLVVGNITIQHQLVVEQPTINKIGVDVFNISVGATYSKLNERNIFTQNVYASIVLYRLKGDFINSFDIEHCLHQDMWVISLNFSSYPEGEYYVKANFYYIGKIVISLSSLTFIIGETESTTSFTSLNVFWGVFVLLSLEVVIFIVKKHNKI